MNSNKDGDELVRLPRLVLIFQLRLMVQGLPPTKMGMNLSVSPAWFFFPPPPPPPLTLRAVRERGASVDATCFRVWGSGSRVWGSWSGVRVWNV